MPKLVITKFNGTSQGWLRFCGQFETQINKSTAPTLTTFSYIKDLVHMKVPNLIDGPLFTEKVMISQRIYSLSAMEIQAKWLAPMDGIFSMLLVVSERDVKKIHEFYETLMFNVESLPTLKILNKLDAAVRLTFVKLQVIQNELPMSNDNCAEWT